MKSLAGMEKIIILSVRPKYAQLIMEGEKKSRYASV